MTHTEQEEQNFKSAMASESMSTIDENWLKELLFLLSFSSTAYPEYKEAAQKWANITNQALKNKKTLPY